MPVSAYVFVCTEPGRAFRVLERVKEIEGVKSANAVTGEFDLVVSAEAEDLSKLGELVVRRIQEVKGVVKTVTAVVVA